MGFHIFCTYYLHDCGKIGHIRTVSITFISFFFCIFANGNRGETSV